MLLTWGAFMYFLCYLQTAMAPKKRSAENDEMTMQTRKAAHFSYSELDEDQGLHFFLYFYQHFM